MDSVNPRSEAPRLIWTQPGFALATVDDAGFPTISYVPFACVSGGFGLVVSHLAAHTANLLARRPACVLLTDEVEPLDAYARVRLSVDVTVRPSAAGSVQADAVWEALEARHGSTVRVLRTLTDFQAVTLEPVRGRLVLGFASAHDVSGAAVAEMLRSPPSE